MLLAKVILLHLSLLFSFSNAIPTVQSDVFARDVCTADSLLNLFNAPPILLKASAFCSSFLGVSTQTISVTATAIATVTSTETDYITTTVTAAPTSSAGGDGGGGGGNDGGAPPGKRDVISYPCWLPNSYLPSQVSSACSCLSIPEPTATDILTATISTTIPATVTETSTAVASPTPGSNLVTYSGVIKITDLTTNSDIGYISTSMGILHEYLLGTIADALQVSFTTEIGATSTSQTGLNILNNSTSFDFVGLVVNEEDTDSTLGSGSYNFLYFTSSTETPPGSVPQIGGSGKNDYRFTEDYESDVFSIDLSTGIITAQWINPNGGSVPLTAFWSDDSENFGFTGDLDAFNNNIDTADPAQFTFVQN